MTAGTFGSEEYFDELIKFYRDIVMTKSYSDQEGSVAQKILGKMKELGYDEAHIDPAGNVCGRVGNGAKVIHFDSHMDTVLAENGAEWRHPPFAGEVEDGMLYGRGSVDMKGGLSASLYAAALAKKLGMLEGKTIWVTGSVCEEYCDGVCLEHFYKDSGVRPDVCVICEPSDNIITLGHTGKVQARIVTHGVSAHGSAPDKGINAVYEMAEIITGIEKLNARLSQTPGSGTIALTHISCQTASLNAVPDRCEIYLDRRLRIGESIAQVKEELAEIVRGKRATVEPGTLIHTSWTGTELRYTPEHNPWKIAEDAPLTLCCNAAYEKTFGHAPERYDFWDFGTNAVVPVSMGVATIGFGPGEYKLAHMTNERCALSAVKDACRFYTNLIEQL